MPHVPPSGSATANTTFKGVLLKLLSVNGLSQENTESNITNYQTLQM